MWAGQSGWGGSSNKWNKDSEPMGEINVTPLVDVMLVLLIIFMVAAPLLTQGINVDLPDAGAPAMQQNIEPLVISIRKNGDIHMQKHKVKIKQLAFGEFVRRVQKFRSTPIGMIVERSFGPRIASRSLGEIKATCGVFSMSFFSIWRTCK